ncbi:hypothetical protein FBU30_004123 [Linnemannia zychae]|nr:hypothetical protein FBU30_004123 [Linnemannia zychae]
MKRAIRSFLGLKAKGKNDKQDKDHPSEKTRSCANSILNPATDLHLHSSSPNRPSVIAQEQCEPYDPQSAQNITNAQQHQLAQSRPRSIAAITTITTTSPPIHFINIGEETDPLETTVYTPDAGNTLTKPGRDHGPQSRRASAPQTTAYGDGKYFPDHFLPSNNIRHQDYGTDTRHEIGLKDSGTNESKLSCKGGIHDLSGLCIYPSIEFNVDPEGGIKQELYDSKAEVTERDESGIYITAAPQNHQQNPRQRQKHHEQYQNGGPFKPLKPSQNRFFDLERDPPSLPKPEPVSNSTLVVENPKKRFNTNRFASHSIFNKRLDSIIKPSTFRTKPFSPKGKGIKRGNAVLDTLHRYLQQDYEVDQCPQDNIFPDQGIHLYNIDPDHNPQLQAQISTKRLTKDYDAVQENETAFVQQQLKEAISFANSDNVSTTTLDTAPSVSQHWFSSTQPKDNLSSSLSTTSSSRSRAASSLRSKRLSNSSRGTAHRIIYSAELAQGLPKGHIAREGNYEIVPTKRLSANSSRSNNTFPRSYTTHVLTTPDNLDGVPGGPAPTPITLIIRPEGRNRSSQVITTINRQELDNSARRLQNSTSISSFRSQDNEGNSVKQIITEYKNDIQDLGIQRMATLGNPNLKGGQDSNQEQGKSKSIDDLSGSLFPRADHNAKNDNIERRLRIAKRPTIASCPTADKQIYLNPQLITTQKSSWIRPARMRMLDMVLNRIDWSQREEVGRISFCSPSTTHFDSDASQDEPLAVTSLTTEDVTPYPFGALSTIHSAITVESMDSSTPDSVHMSELPPFASIVQPVKAPVLINGLTSEELIDSIRFESDREGSPGFYGRREFELDEERRPWTMTRTEQE